MKTNVLLIIEVFLVITVLFFFLNNLIPKFHLDLTEFIEEDVYASLISVNYQNFSNINELNKILCSIIEEITEEYAIYTNRTFVCGENKEEYKRSIKTFYIVNGEIIEVLIKLK